MNNVKKQKKALVLSIVGVITLIAVIAGATYAYFQAQGGGAGSTDVNVKTATTDNLSFQVGSGISISASQEDFGQGMPNKSGSTTASAILTANNATNTATRNYYIYLDITSNEFVYTTDGREAELLLKVTSPTGEVTTINGLDAQVTSGSVTGFDITTASGLIKIADNYEITANPSKTDEWMIEIILVNLDSDQNANTGKTFNANIIIQEEKIPTTLADVCPEGGNLASCITSLYNERGDEEANGLYYHDGLGTYINAEEEAGDNSYRYAGGDYLLTSKATNAGYTSITTKSNDETNGLINFYCNGSKSHVGAYCASYNPSYYTTAYDESVQYESYQEALEHVVVVDGYLTSGNIHNYVCFGSTDSPCPTENLYRIIGIFADDKDTNYQAKLIKADYVTSTMLGTDGRDYYGVYSESSIVAVYYIGSMDTSTIATYRWNFDTSAGSYGSNNWTTSEFNTINLNTNYWNYLGPTWQNLIAKTTWHLGGMTSSKNTAKAFYDGERNNLGYGSNPTAYTDEIGLMYASDYGYATSPDAWTTNLWSTLAETRNWLYMGLVEWTISPDSSNSKLVFHVGGKGDLSFSGATSGYAARPVFYLNSNVEFLQGDGTKENPYILKIN